VQKFLNDRIPRWEAAEVVPRSAGEALAFLDASAGDPLHPAFVLLLLYGLRRGEVLGSLGWTSTGKRSGFVSRCSASAGSFAWAW
jgi:hypothetical protein